MVRKPGDADGRSGRRKQPQIRLSEGAPGNLERMGMTASFLILAMMTLAGGVAAMTLRRLVHCALALTVAFAGLAALYLNLGAEFAGLAQLLVYVGAIAILIVFAILLTPTPLGTNGEAEVGKAFSPAGLAGALLALAVFAVLAWAVVTSSVARESGTAAAPQTSMREIGLTLMQRYVLPLEVIALMLTAAMIGAVILALREKRPGTKTGAAPANGVPDSPELRA